MNIPTDARQLGTFIRIGVVGFLLGMCTLAAAILHAPTASAAGLLPKIVHIELPLGDTPLEKVLKPVTNVTNNLLPVTINAGGDSIGATITPPANIPVIGRPADQPLVNINIPVQPAARSTAQPTTHTAVAQPAPAPTSTPTPVSKQPAIAKATTSSTGDARVLGASIVPAMITRPGAPAFGFALPATIPTNHNWKLAARSYTQPQDYTPAIISLAIFFAVIAMIVNILYVSRNNGFVWEGHSRLAKLSTQVDLAQLAVLVVSLAGTCAVIAVLVIAQA